MERIQKKPPILAAVGVGLSGAVSAVFPLALFVAPGLSAFMLLAGGALHFLLAILTGALVAYLLTGLSGLITIGWILLVSLTLGFMLRKKKTYFDICMVLSIFFAIGVYLESGGLQDALSGAKPFYTVQHATLQIWDLYFEQLAAMPALFPGAQIDLLYETGRASIAFLPVYMPAAIVILGTLPGFFNTLLCGRLCNRARAGVRPMRPFNRWALPKSFTYGMAAMAITLVLASLIGVSSMDAIIIAAVALVSVPLFIQGLSLFVFLLRMRKQGNGLFLTLVILLLVLTPLSVIWAVILLGVFEQFAHLRRRISVQKTKKPD